MSHESQQRKLDTTLSCADFASSVCDESGDEDLGATLLEHLFSEVSLSLFVLDNKARVMWTNVSEERIDSQNHDGQGLVPGARVGESFTAMFRRSAALGDGMAAEALSGIMSVLGGCGETFEMDYPAVNQEALRWYRMRVCPLAGRHEIIVTYKDITDRKRREHELRRYRQMFDNRRGLLGREQKQAHKADERSWHAPWLQDSIFKQATAVFLNSSEAVVITDAELRIANVNKGFTHTTGFSFSEVVGLDIGMLDASCYGQGAHESDLCRAVRANGHWQGELKTRRSNNECFHSWGSIDVVLDAHGMPERYIFVFSDITRIKESQARIHYLAHHDPLTGLANRLLFWARLEQSIAHAARHSRKIALVFVDIDDFKLVNDALGHPMGDALLKVIAKRLSSEVRGEDTVARLGGDEFALIAEGISSRANVHTFIQKLGSGLMEEVKLKDKSFIPSASIGFAIYPDDGLTAEELYRHADQNMYLKKAIKRDQEMNSAVLDHRDNLNRL